MSLVVASPPSPTPTGDHLHHPHHSHHPHSIGLGSPDDDDGSLSPDEDGRTRRRPTRGQSRIEFERLAAFFHVPINEAAKGLGVCATVLKKVCRKHGIPRWPHRKIKKLDTMLAMLETAANKPGNPQHDDDVRKKMDAVMRDRMVLMTEGKLLGEGKSEGRRSKSGGEGKKEGGSRKRKKPATVDSDEEEDDGHHGDESLSPPHHSHHQEPLTPTGYMGETHDLLHDSTGQMMGISPQHMGLSTMDLQSLHGLNAYHVYGYNTLTTNGGYPVGMGVGVGGVNGMNAMQVVGNGMGGYHTATAYNSIYWNGNAPNANLPGVHTINGLISSTTGMMMHNLPPLPHNASLSASMPNSNSSSPSTPVASLSNSALLPHHSSSPYSSHHPHHSKHAKLSHDAYGGKNDPYGKSDPYGVGKSDPYGGGKNDPYGKGGDPYAKMDSYVKIEGDTNSYSYAPSATGDYLAASPPFDMALHTPSD